MKTVTLKLVVNDDEAERCLNSISDFDENTRWGILVQLDIDEPTATELKSAQLQGEADS